VCDFHLGGNLKVFRNDQCILEASQLEIENVILEIMKGKLHCATVFVLSGKLNDLFMNLFTCGHCVQLDFARWCQLSIPREASSLVSCSVNGW
jgi:hypothetical protein